MSIYKVECVACDNAFLPCSPPPPASFKQREGLQNYVSEFGKVNPCTIIRVTDNKLRRFAFLTFENPASVKIREHFLDGNAIRAPHIPEKSL